MSGARRTWIAVGALGGAIVLVNVVLAFVRHYTADPGGPTSSSYATAPEGLAAYADLLAQDGHRVTQLRDVPARARLDPGSTVVLLDPRDVGPADARALRRFLEAGGRLLAHADDAKLGLSLAGPAGRPVAFVESVHGYGHASGLGAIPTSWRFALGGLVLAALVLIWARGRRLGPAEELERPLPPPRREYVEALASLLERSRDPAAAIAPLQAELRRRLERQGAAGLSAKEVEAALAPPKRPEDVVAAGRALARLERGSA